MIRVELPAHLRTLAGVDGDALVQVDGPVTPRAILDALEAAHPRLRGSIRMHGTLARRPFVRYFACARDYSHEPVDVELPAEVGEGREPFIVLGAISGG